MRRALIRVLFAIIAASATIPAAAQFTASGTEPGSVKWETFRSANFKLIFPQGLDSLARAYAASLESYRIRGGNTLGHRANEFYSSPMPAIMHNLTGYSNGSVAWAPRNLSLYTNPESYDPDPQRWMDQLAVHEGRHVAQMQLGMAAPKFELFYYLTGEIFNGTLSTIYSGPTFLEGDAVAAETALTDAGRGRTADFLSYYRVSFAEKQWRDYWKWSYGSLAKYTPDYYRAGYMLHAGMRNTFDKPDFAKYYYKRLIRKPLYPIMNLQKSVKEVSGLRFRKAFRKIEEDFAADWAENDTLRLEAAGAFMQPGSLTSPTRYFRSFRGITVLDGNIYAVRSGLDLVSQLVRIDSCGKQHPLCNMASMASRLAASSVTGKIYWTEHDSDLRWEKKSSSKVWSLDPKTGKRKALTGPDKRYYNPAPSETEAVLAVVENRPDATTALVLIDAADGTVLRSIKAPAAMQLVEPAWLDGKLYASAITDGGFGIYAVDGWKEILRPEVVKINRLFGRDGRLWFSNDRDGVVELHSLGADGVLRQETNLRFGGQNWAFAGDSLLFTSLTLKDNGIRSIAADSLLGMAVLPSPFPRPIPDKLSWQEDSLSAAAGQLITEIAPEDLPLSPKKTYSKLGNLFKFHSWAPVYVDEDIVSSMSFEDVEMPATIGATVWFQNDIETSYGQIGAQFLGLDLPALHLQWVYKGFAPVIELRAQVGGRKARAVSYNIDINPDSISLIGQIDTFATPLVSGSVLMYYPMNFSSGGWQRGVVPSLSAACTNDWSPVLSIKDHVIHETLAPGLAVQAAVRAYAMTATPPSGIFPRLGAGIELGVTDRPLHRAWRPATAYANLYGYLPGLGRTHGVRLQTIGSYGFGGHWTSDASFSASAEYAMPFASVDWSFLSPITYIRNFELRVDGSYSYNATTSKLNGKTDSHSDLFIGASLLARLANIAWLPFDGYLGVKYRYNPLHPDLSGFDTVFTVSL